MMYFTKADWKNGKLIKSGKANDVYEAISSSGLPVIDAILIKSSGRVSANDGERTADEVPYKAQANNLFSSVVFKKLNLHGIPTHYLGAKDETTKMVLEAEMLPLEVLIRLVAAGSFCRRYQIEEGFVFGRPYIEFSYKCDESHDPIITEDAMIELGILDRHGIQLIRRIALDVLPIVKETADACGANLLDLKLEFGHIEGQLSVADEISLDTCRLRDKKTGQKLDKDPFREGASVEETANGYLVMLERIKKYIWENDLAL